jgi:hypothetical protein
MMSLRRLDVETIDLVQLHRIDTKVPQEEQFGVLKELQDEGKVRYLGLSNVSVDQIEADARSSTSRRCRTANLADQTDEACSTTASARGSVSCRGFRSLRASCRSLTASSARSPRRTARRPARWRSLGG